MLLVLVVIALTPGKTHRVSYIRIKEMATELIIWTECKLGTPVAISSIGKIVGLTDIYYVGTNGVASNLNGLEGEFQIIRGTFTSTQLLQIVTNYFATKKCLASYPNQISGGIWIDWQTIIDKWGVQGALTNIGGFPIVRVKIYDKSRTHINLVCSCCIGGFIHNAHGTQLL